MASDTPIPADDLARSGTNLSGLAYAALAPCIHGPKPPRRHRNLPQQPKFPKRPQVQR